MLKQNLLLIYRNFKKYRVNFFINLIGLSIGLACALLIYLWVKDELTIDRFHKNSADLYQIMKNITTAEGMQTQELTPVPLAASLLERMPEVESAVAVNDFFSGPGKPSIFSFGNKNIQVQGWHTDADFFKVFSYKVLQGNKATALIDKNNIMISKDLALKLFGTEEVLGKVLKWKHPAFEGIFQIAGVFELPASGNTAQFDFISSIEILLDHDRFAKNWTNSYAKTYVMLKKGISVYEFNQKIAGFLKKQNTANASFRLFAQNYADKYLYNQYTNGKISGGRILYVHLFSVIALFILLIACVNFISISTARATLRMKEIGVKKVIGATRKNLIVQFLSESVVIVILSLFVAFLWVELLLPQFDQITGKNLNLVFDKTNLLALFCLVLFTGIVSGCYPAFYLSRFDPLKVLKGKLDASTGSVWIRKGLVSFQFLLSVIFIIGLLVINKQVKFIQTKDLGYNRENLMTFEWKGELFDQWNGLLEGKKNDKFESFMLALSNIPGVESTSSMSGDIFNDIYKVSDVSWSGQSSDQKYIFQSPVVGYKFIETLGMKMKEGRGFSRDFADNESRIILNETAVKLMGLENPVGKSIKMNGSSQIIGVVKDFNYGTLHNTIEPLIFRFSSAGRNILVKFKPDTEVQTKLAIKSLYSRFLPGYTFNLNYLDEEYKTLYTAETQVSELSKYFAGLGIFISCMGLFGLAAFTAQRRQKEISIRKILGASAPSLIALLADDFIRVILIAMIIAVPVSWFLMEAWLQSFAYRINISWWIFALAGLSAIMAACIAIASQFIRTIRMSPINALKSE